MMTMTALSSVSDLLHSAPELNADDGVQNTKIGTWFTPIFSRFFDGAILNDLIGQYSWLPEFREPEGASLAQSLAIFKEDSNGMTIVLQKFLEYKASTEVASCAERWMKDFSTHSGHNHENNLREILELNPNVYKNFELIGAAIVRVLNSWARPGGFPAEWETLCRRVREFCLQAGSPTAISDPFKNVDLLRTKAFAAMSSHREDMLSARIKELEDQAKKDKELLGKQNRIITNLSYRHVLEGLSGFPKSGSVGPDWKNFWRKAMTNATNELNAHKSGTPLNHPLATVLSDFHTTTNSMNRRSIDTCGENMYGTLSSNIHNYRGVYNVDRNQWDDIAGAVLTALTPQMFDADLNIEWTDERARY